MGYEVAVLGLSRFRRISYLFGLFIADRQTKMGEDRLSRMKIPPQSALQADPNLKLVTERSPYMRSER
jgi:hypothetical protein